MSDCDVYMYVLWHFSQVLLYIIAIGLINTDYAEYFKVRWDVIVQVGMDCGIGCGMSVIECTMHVAAKGLSYSVRRSYVL